MTSIIRLTKTKVFKSETRPMYYSLNETPQRKKMNNDSMYESYYLNVTFENQSHKNVRVNYDQKSFLW